MYGENGRDIVGSDIEAGLVAFPGSRRTRGHGRAQWQIIDRLGMGGRISAAIGVAGSGKSTLLKPLVRAWRDDGRDVYGIALAWRQSDDLAEGGIEARNARAVASFLEAVKVERLHLDRKSVVVIDEVGLLGTRQLNGHPRRPEEGRLPARDARRSKADAIVRGGISDRVAAAGVGRGQCAGIGIHAIPAGSRLVSAFGAYTSGSRHWEQSFVVTSEGAERTEIVARRPLGDRREILRGDILNNITRNFSQQPVKESALDMLDRAVALRRGTIRAIQTSLQSMESRAAAQGNPSTLNARFVNRRINQALEERLPGLVERLRRRGETLARAVQAGAAMVERLAAIARRHVAKRETGAEYWRKVQRAGEQGSRSRQLAIRLRSRAR
jgi:hypothetical protein